MVSIETIAQTHEQIIKDTAENTILVKSLYDRLYGPEGDIPRLRGQQETMDEYQRAISEKIIGIDSKLKLGTYLLGAIAATLIPAVLKMLGIL